MIHHESLPQKILLFYLYSENKLPRIKPDIKLDRLGAYAQKRLHTSRSMLQSV